MRETDLAYLAGVVDADGYITANISTHAGRRYFGIRVGISGSRREPHDLAVAIFGGKVTSHQPTADREHHKVQYGWQFTGQRATPVLEAICPFLRVKREQADLALSFQEQLDLLRATREMGNFAPWQPCDWDPTPSLMEAAEQIRALNARGRRGRASGVAA